MIYAGCISLNFYLLFWEALWGYLQANKLNSHHNSTVAFGKLGVFTFVEGVYIRNVDLPVKSIHIEKQKLLFR